MSFLALLPSQHDTQGSLHASCPGAQCGPRLASKANHHDRSQARPRKRFQLLDNGQLLTPAVDSESNLLLSYRIHVKVSSTSSVLSQSACLSCVLREFQRHYSKYITCKNQIFSVLSVLLISPTPSFACSQASVTFL